MVQLRDTAVPAVYIILEKIKVLLITSRPILWLGPIGIYFIGVQAAKVDFNFFFWLGLFFVTFPMGILVYGLNDISDYKSDIINPRKGSWEGGVLNRKYTSIICYAILVSILIVIFPLLIFKYYFSVGLIICITLFAYLYSCKPVRLKSIPFLDSLSNGLWVALILIFGFSFTKGSSQLPLIIFPIFLGVTAMHALTTLMDYDEDKLSGDKTISVYLGKRVTSLISSLIFFSLIFLIKPINFFVMFYLILGGCLILTGLILDKKNVYHFVSWTIGLLFSLLIFYLLIFEKNYVNLILSRYL